MTILYKKKIPFMSVSRKYYLYSVGNGYENDNYCQNANLINFIIVINSMHIILYSR